MTRNAGTGSRPDRILGGLSWGLLAGALAWAWFGPLLRVPTPAGFAVAAVLTLSAAALAVAARVGAL